MASCWSFLAESVTTRKSTSLKDNHGCDHCGVLCSALPPALGMKCMSWEDRHAGQAMPAALCTRAARRDVKMWIYSVVLLLVKRTMCLCVCVFMVDTLASGLLHLIFVLCFSTNMLPGSFVGLLFIVGSCPVHGR